MIQNLTVDSGFSQNIINNNPLLESLDEAIWRADRNELSGLLIEVETMEPREATSTDITPLVEMSSEQEMVFEEQGLNRFSENVLSMLSGAAIVGTGVSMYNINKNHNASRPQDADFDRLFQDSIQEHRINSGDHTTEEPQNEAWMNTPENQERIEKGLRPINREAWDTPVGRFLGMEDEDADVYDFLRLSGSTGLVLAGVWKGHDAMLAWANPSEKNISKVETRQDKINKITNKIRKDIPLNAEEKVIQAEYRKDSLIRRQALKDEELAKKLRNKAKVADAWKKVKSFKLLQKEAGKRNTPKFKKAAAKASFPRTGGGVLLGLDMIHIIRSVVEADTKDLTDGWEGPWIQEFFKGLGTMAIGGEESLDVLQNATMKDLVWYAGALTGINPSAKLEILKQIPKSIKDVSVAMIIDPLAWAVSGIPEGETVHPMNSIQGQSTPMGQYPPQVWE